MTTTPAATPATQEPRVSDEVLSISCRVAERSPLLSKNGAIALDLRDARATIASQAEALAAKEAECERLREWKHQANGWRERATTAEAALKAAKSVPDQFMHDEVLSPGAVACKQTLAALTPKEPTP